MTKRKPREVSSFKVLPCLRCGRFSVGFLLPMSVVRIELGDLMCKHCETAHFLTLRAEDGNRLAIYDRDTRRYPSDHYDEQPFVLIKHEDVPLNHPSDNEAPFPGRGPIVIFVRKRYFSREEVFAIWKKTNGRCHLCRKKKWKLSERGRHGWHIDHFIPHSGGGRETEMMGNFLVACAPCNLRKGRGYTNRILRESVLALFG